MTSNMYSTSPLPPSPTLKELQSKKKKGKLNRVFEKKKNCVILKMTLEFFEKYNHVSQILFLILKTPNDSSIPKFDCAFVEQCLANKKVAEFQAYFDRWTSETCPKEFLTWSNLVEAILNHEGHIWEMISEWHQNNPHSLNKFLPWQEQCLKDIVLDNENIKKNLKLKTNKGENQIDLKTAFEEWTLEIFRKCPKLFISTQAPYVEVLFPSSDNAREILVDENVRIDEPVLYKLKTIEKLIACPKSMQNPVIPVYQSGKLIRILNLETISNFLEFLKVRILGNQFESNLGGTSDSSSVSTL